MTNKSIVFVLLISGLMLSGCAAPDLTEIRTTPPGATVTIDGQKAAQITPFPYPFNFDSKKTYKLSIFKEGYFEEEISLTEQHPFLSKGNVTVDLTQSPLWAATSASPATNNWLQILVGSSIDAKTAWQIMIDAVIKRSSNVKELNYESGYLQTKHSVKKFETKNGEFLLRCQLIATLVSAEPLIYRVKDVAEWSANGVQWHPYNRIFTEHAEMITEIEDRLKGN